MWYNELCSFYGRCQISTVDKTGHEEQECLAKSSLFSLRCSNRRTVFLLFIIFTKSIVFKTLSMLILIKIFNSELTYLIFVFLSRCIPTYHRNSPVFYNGYSEKFAEFVAKYLVGVEISSIVLHNVKWSPLQENVGVQIFILVVNEPHDAIGKQAQARYGITAETNRVNVRFNVTFFIQIEYVYVLEEVRSVLKCQLPDSIDRRFVFLVPIESFRFSISVNRL